MLEFLETPYGVLREGLRCSGRHLLPSLQLFQPQILIFDSSTVEVEHL